MMIVGSIYLGKKARSAYRKKQAEKAAQKLTHPFDIVDPSDEIQPSVPPSSPSGTDASSTPLSIVPSETLSKLGSRTSNLSHSNSATSQRRSVDEQEYRHYAQRDSGHEEPPSYDTIMSTGPTSAQQSDVSPTSRPQSQYSSEPSSAISPPSAYPSSTFSDRFQRDCSTCITMMEQFQTIYPHPHNTSSTQSRAPHLSRVPEQSSMSAVAEMPDQSVYQQRPLPSGTGPVLEAPDTGTYRGHSAAPAVEMPADNEPVELPAEFSMQDLSELMRADTVASKYWDYEPGSAKVSNSEILERRGET